MANRKINNNISTSAISRACFKKNSSLHISQKNFSTTFFRILPKNIYIFSLSKILMTLFLVIGLLNVVVTPLHPLLCIPPHAVLHVSTLCFMLSYNNKYSVNHLFLLNSSLHKQPFITAYFRSSLHILCITAH